MIRTEKPDAILFTSMVTASLAPWLKFRGITTPLLTLSHGHDVTLNVKPYQRWLPRVFSALDHVISVSQATQQETLKRGLHPEKSTVIHNGIDLATESALPEPEVAIRQLPLSPNVPVLLTVGRLVKRKGHAWFISKVLPLVKTPIQYVVIGEGPESEVIQQAVEPIHKQGIHQVILMGRQEQSVLNAAYRVADLFIMPNIQIPGDMEGFGVVLLEANLASTPAIVSDLEGMKDVIQPGENGFRIEPENHEAFARKIDELIHRDKIVELNSLAERSRQYVHEHFIWNKIVEQYVQVIDRTTRDVESYAPGINLR
jgi:phosphatidylinositol alpha-1,6-mannosyltransferase